jgi:hypothetical protein
LIFPYFTEWKKRAQEVNTHNKPHARAKTGMADSMAGLGAPAIAATFGVVLEVGGARRYLKSISKVSAEGSTGSPHVVLLALQVLGLQPEATKIILKAGWAEA